MLKVDKVLLLAHLSAGLQRAKAYIDTRIAELSEATLGVVEELDSSLTSLEKEVEDLPDVAYGTCSTAAATAAKVISISGNAKWTLKAGSVIIIKFANAVPANATMNVNGKGAKSIYYRGKTITAGVINAGDTATFIYNGSQYILIALDKTLSLDEITAGIITDETISAFTNAGITIT